MPTPARVATPDEIRLARKRLGMTQEAFAKLLGFKGYATVSDWERGVVVPSIPAALMEEVVNRALGVRQDGHFVDPRTYALTVLATVEADVQRYAAGTLERIAEARRVLGLEAVSALDATAAVEHAALRGAPPQKKRRGGAR